MKRMRYDTLHQPQTANALTMVQQETGPHVLLMIPSNPDGAAW